MEHLLKKKYYLFFLLFILLLCCTQEESISQQDIETKEIGNFFTFNRINTRSNDNHQHLIEIVINTLYQQENLIDAIRFYKEQYGTPMWEHTITLATENGFQLYVPIYTQRYKNEIKIIWNFGIYNNKLYHFIDVRKEDFQYVNQYWKFDYFTYYTLDKEPKSGLKFYTGSRATYKCVHAYITVGEGESAHTEYKGMHCWEIDEDEYFESVPDPGGSNGGFNSGIDLGENEGGGSNGGGSGGSSSSSSNDLDSTTVYKTTEDRINEELRTNCGIAAILDAIDGLNNLTGGVLISLDYTGGYNATNKTILMAKGWDGDVTSKTFLEELIHFMQDQVYSGGIGTLWSTATTNIEFEAKVMVDSYSYGKSEKFYRNESVVLQRINYNDISSEEYESFIKDIKKGKIKFEKYINMLNLYNTYTPYSEYKDKINPTLSPSLLNTYGEKMFSNKCK